MPMFDPYDALIPIYLETRIPQRLKQMGTAVFVELHGKPFLFTAAHVTDESKYGELLVPTSKGLSPIEGYVAYIDLPGDVSRAEDKTDVAYYRLSSEFAKELRNQFQPLPQSRLELITNAMELSVCSASGYPASKARKSRENVHSSEIFSFRGVAAKEEAYLSLNFSPEHNIILGFSKKRAIDRETGKPYATPSLRGISGGGIFAWPQGEELSEDWSLPKLVGLVHTFREKEGLIMGTTLLPLMSAIGLGEMKGFGGVR
jgi:hypothetical protein